MRLIVNWIFPYTNPRIVLYGSQYLPSCRAITLGISMKTQKQHNQSTERNNTQHAIYVTTHKDHTFNYLVKSASTPSFALYRYTYLVV